MGECRGSCVAPPSALAEQLPTLPPPFTPPPLLCCSGFTAKVAGTEEGVLAPQATFSPCYTAASSVWHPVRRRWSSCCGRCIGRGTPARCLALVHAELD